MDVIHRILYLTPSATPKNFVSKEEIKQAIIQGTLLPECLLLPQFVLPVHPTYPGCSSNASDDDFSTPPRNVSRPPLH